MEDTKFLDRAKDVLAHQHTETDFLRLVALYLNGTESQRDVVRSAWSPRHRWKVPRSSDFPLKGGLPPEQRLMGSLAYKSIEDNRMDWRDTLVGLAADEFAAGKAGLDFPAMVDLVVKASTPAFAEFLRSWLARKPEDRSLKAFGWADQSTTRHVKLVPTA